ILSQFVELLLEQLDLGILRLEMLAQPGLDLGKIPKPADLPLQQLTRLGSGGLQVLQTCNEHATCFLGVDRHLSRLLQFPLCRGTAGQAPQELKAPGQELRAQLVEVQLRSAELGEE